MSRFAEWLVWTINRLVPQLSVHKDVLRAQNSVSVNVEWAYKEIQRIWDFFAPYHCLKDKIVLDIGTGLGGKIPFYAALSPQTLMSIDIDISGLAIAQRCLETTLPVIDAGKVSLIASNAAALPFPSGYFDIVVSINTFEHIIPLKAALRETYRVLRHEGLALLYLPPYYSPWGPHLEKWIHFPWPHLFFSEKTLMRVVERIDSELHLNEQVVGFGAFDWEPDDDQLPGVNRVTLKQFRRMANEVGFSVVSLRLLPFGHDFLHSNAILKRLVLFLLNILCHVPFLQEAVVTKMIYVLQKKNG